MLLKLIKSKCPWYQELGETDAIRPVLRLLYRSRADQALWSGLGATDLIKDGIAPSDAMLDEFGCIAWLFWLWDCWAV